MLSSKKVFPSALKTSVGRGFPSSSAKKGGGSLPHFLTSGYNEVAYWGEEKEGRVSGNYGKLH